MKRIQLTKDSRSWKSLRTLRFQSEMELDPRGLEVELRNRLHYDTIYGLTVEHSDGRYFVITYPDETIEGVQLTGQVIAKTLEKIESEVLEAQRQARLLSLVKG